MLVLKQKNKRRKMYHFYNLINDFNYYDFSTGILTENNYQFKGCLYVLEKPDKNILDQIIQKYDNTKVITRQHLYAPEIVDTCLFIAR